ncbi:PREDICTED: tyrosine-protein phosphatase non-receptor type 23 isoform X1 [Rhagoletis zephyria]|uniref:tyrosine-protein phosphatase non-receptor type 23 isoform X1 n=1 Tax=Rhagoletis zephyria TaxID=28612 RepID=UPI0008117DD3|nr:PREDICTED: tyrosine-protein phosphatase non-receptor type 23 isoform X1 [Rhagoletis zephyria]
MEAVPRLHMLWFVLKSSPTGTSFANLKKYIAEFYQEDPEAYSKEVFALETLRNQALHPGKDKCAILKRYYCQLHSLQNRFPQLAERSIFTFTWKDLYLSNVNEYTDLRYELAAVLFNIAASHTQMGASVTRGDVDGMKLACTHFQCAAWAFGELRERFTNFNGGGDFMTTELLVFMQQVSFAQAQECILEKSLIDNRKPNIVAKVTAQIVVYYGAALAALLTGGDDGPIAQVVDSSVFKLWKKYVRFKISYLTCILYLYQGQHAEEQAKMGERVTLYQAAWEKLEEARKESKGLPDQKEINESLIFTADVVEGKRKNAKNENEFIYHEVVPELTSITAVQGANLVNGTSFSITDPDVAGEDIFARLVPMKAHEASSLYSEEKAKLLRKYGSNIEEKDAELASFMSSLTLDNLNINEEKANKIPQGIVDRCAELNANKTAIQDLIAAMSQLAEICADVETNLKEISTILAEEERQENDFQKITGVQRTPNPHITELTREFQKYTEAHARAGESNDTLRKAMELHVNNLKILSRPLQDIQQSVPKLSAELNTTELFKDVKLILNKANEMKAQRAQFHADLRIAVNDDDITAKVIAHGSDEGLQLLFERELAKHERLTQLLDQNMLAQKNILQALTEAYAKAAPVLKTLADVKHKREAFFSSLAASYDVYEDLLAKSAKGLEFYKKLSSNVQKLLTRLKAARDVQFEERQQRLKNQTNVTPTIPINTAKPLSSNIAPNSTTSTSSTPKLRDYLKSKNPTAGSIVAAGAFDSAAKNSVSQNAQYIPPVRPNPLGSENPTQAACSSGSFYTAHAINSSGAVHVVAPNEPPPPYSLQQQQYYDPHTAGYTNPMYQQQQQNIAPPAYKLQASPNSQFAHLNSSIPNLTGGYNNHTTLGQNDEFAQQQRLQQQQQLMMQQTVPNNPAYGQQPTSVAAESYAANQSNFMQHQQAASTVPTNTRYQLNTNNIQAYNLGYASQPPTQGCLPTQSISGTATDARAAPIGSQTASQMHTVQQPYSQASAYNVGTPTSRPLYVATSDIAQAPASASPLSVQATYGLTSWQQSPYSSGASNVGGTSQYQQNNAFQQQLPQSQPNYPPASCGINAVSSEAYPASSVAQQGVQITASTLSNVTTPNLYPYSTITKHPGYSFNPQTGQYEYGSGYQHRSDKFYSQYTSSSTPKLATVGTTDSENASKINVATGFESPVVSHTKSNVASVGQTSNTISSNTDKSSNLSYYSAPYGYQSQGIASPYAIQLQQHHQQLLQQSLASAQQQQVQQKPQQTNYQQQQSTYMQSGGASIAPTQTTKSASEYSFGTKQNEKTSNSDSPAPTDMKPGSTVAQSHDVNKPTPKPIKKTTNIDLLTDIDFSNGGLTVPPPILPQPILKPEIVASPPSSQVAVKANLKSTPKETSPEKNLSSTLAASLTPTANLEAPTLLAAPLSPPLASIKAAVSPINSPATRKPSLDNLSTCSDLSSLDTNFDWDSVSVRNDQPADKHSNVSPNAAFQLKPFDPFNDDKILKYFHKEVERYEKIIESLNVKMLNGNTQLSAKWKELHDLLSKDASKRTTTIAKLFPEKNRSLDCIPYDHARVKLEKDTDDYINAAYIKNLGTGCPNLIIAQTPQQNTINDFWSMIWSQKARTVACLHTPNEMLDPYWPQERDLENHYDDFTVKCVKINSLSHCVEYNLKLSMHGADAIVDLSVLQIKAWTKSLPSQIIGIARNALQAHQQRCLEFNTPSAPLIMNCLNGSERSELVAIAICAILALQTTRPVLINVVDIWYRICLQRQHALRDMETLEQSMQIVLNHAHDVLNKRGIMTSYQMKIAPQIASKEKEEIKDPLNELDPLWKMK